MKKPHILLGAAVLFALCVTGCETDGITARTKEKSAAYAALEPWEKKYIDTGVIALGFTTDMGYMAIGNASKVQPLDTPEGKAEVWIYSRYYPTDQAAKMKYSLNTEPRTYTPSSTSLTPLTNPNLANANRTRGNVAATDGSQSGDAELKDLASYTLQVTFLDGKASKLKLDPN